MTVGEINLIKQLFGIVMCSVFVNVWLVRPDIKEEDLKLPKEEVSEVRWATLEEIREMAAQNTFVSVTLEGLNACEMALEAVQN